MWKVLDLFLLLFTWILCCGNRVLKKPLSSYTVMFFFIRLKYSFPTVVYCVSAFCLHKNEAYSPLITLNFQIQTISVGYISSSVLPTFVVLIMFSEFFCNSCFFFLKVLVPLVLLQQFLMELTRRGQEPLSALVNFGVTYLEDYSADYIIQQGGWVRR